MPAQEPPVPEADEVRGAFHESNSPVLTANEVGDRLGVTRRTALRWLKQLRGDGLVERKEVGARAVVWWWTGTGGTGDRDEEVREYLERALDELPPNAPGRTAVEDALAVLERGEDH